MKMPDRIMGITTYIEELFSETGTLPAPLILKGDDGVGKSWILSELFKRLLKNKERIIYPIRINYQLSSVGLVDSIKKQMKRLEDNVNLGLTLNRPRTEVKFVLIWDSFDRLYNIYKHDNISQFPKRNYGAGSPIIQRIQHSSELRSFLIENSTKVTMIGASQMIDFMTDEDLPFFNFFNIIAINSLDEIESEKYINSNIEHNESAKQFYKIISNSNLYSGLKVCDGRISYLNLFADCLLENYNDCDSLKEFLEKFYSSYFKKLNPFMELSLGELSEVEKEFLSTLVTSKKNQGTVPSIDMRNMSRVVKNMINKKILVPDSSPKKGYFLCSSAQEEWIAYNNRLVTA